MIHGLPALIIASMILGLVVVGSGAVAPALGADCGDGLRACRCGDRVVTNTLLDAKDPVLTIKDGCECDGLTVKSGVSLTISGTIRGVEPAKRKCPSGNILPSGIIIEPGASDVTIREGAIIGFELGIRTDEFVGATGTHIERITIRDVFRGMMLLGNDFEIRNNTILCAAQSAIDLTGDGGTVCNNRVSFAGLGIVIEGNVNTICSNLSTSQARRERTPACALPTAAALQASGTSTAGTGIQVSGSGNVIKLNRSDHNAGYGFSDSDPEANTYSRNRCTGNGQGKSFPPGLCR